MYEKMDKSEMLLKNNNSTHKNRWSHFCLSDRVSGISGFTNNREESYALVKWISPETHIKQIQKFNLIYNNWILNYKNIRRW